MPRRRRSRRVADCALLPGGCRGWDVCVHCHKRFLSRKCPFCRNPYQRIRLHRLVPEDGGGKGRTEFVRGLGFNGILEGNSALYAPSQKWVPSPFCHVSCNRKGGAERATPATPQQALPVLHASRQPAQCRLHLRAGVGHENPGPVR